MMMDKEHLMDEIYKKVKSIRKELNLKETEFEIVDLEIKSLGPQDDAEKIGNEKTFLIIYTLTRSDKSTLIGPGGWAIGKLSKSLRDLFNKDLIIRVESYVDKVILDEKTKHAIKFLEEKNLKINDEKVLVLVQCKYDLPVLAYLKEFFQPFGITYDLGTVILPPKNKKAIEDVLKILNIPHKFIEPFKLGKDDILSAIENYPCYKVCNSLEKYVISEAKDMGIKCIINNHMDEDYVFKDGIHIVNFLKLYPLKRNSLIKKLESILEFSNSRAQQIYLDCPLMIQSYKKNKNTKIKLIEDIVSDVYNGLIEPTEGSEEIMKIVKI